MPLRTAADRHPSKSHVGCGETDAARYSLAIVSVPGDVETPTNVWEPMRMIMD